MPNIHQLIIRGDTAACQVFFLRYGTQIPSETWQRFATLAVQTGKFTILQLVIQHVPWVLDFVLGYNSLAMAIFHGHEAITAFLLQKEAIWTIEAIQAAIKIGALELVKRAYIADSVALDQPADYLREKLLHPAFQYGHLEIIQYLMSQDLNPDISCLEWAIVSGKQECLDILRQSCHFDWRCGLATAVHQKKLNVVQYLHEVCGVNFQNATYQAKLALDLDAVDILYYMSQHGFDLRSLRKIYYAHKTGRWLRAYTKLQRGLRHAAARVYCRYHLDLPDATLIPEEVYQLLHEIATKPKNWCR